MTGHRQSFFRHQTGSKNAVWRHLDVPADPYPSQPSACFGRSFRSRRGPRLEGRGREGKGGNVSW